MISGVENNAGPNNSGVTGVVGFRGASFLATLLGSSFSLLDAMRIFWITGSGRVTWPSGFSLRTEGGLRGAVGTVKTT